MFSQIATENTRQSPKLGANCNILHYSMTILICINIYHSCKLTYVQQIKQGSICNEGAIDVYHRILGYIMFAKRTSQCIFVYMYVPRYNV